MKKTHTELLIKVNRLAECRQFYRDVLDLGTPVFDSNFAVSFRLCDHTFLTLELTAANYLEHDSNAMIWRFEVDELESFRKRLTAAGCELELLPGSSGTWRGYDPEGNRFYVREAR